MGGKKQPRTKNNAQCCLPHTSLRNSHQPSSSGRHAQRLGSGQLIGFSALNDLGYVPAAVGGAAAVTDGIGDVSAQMRAVLKKMAKRDAITKSKAVQEYSELCDSLELEEVTATLPFWPRLYRKLATDPDNRVREVSQVALHRLLSRVRKAATPHMTDLVPAWLCSLSDPHPPAASAARRAFQTVFPAAEKQAGVAKFCYSSILAHIKEGLYELTPQTYSDASVLSADEMEARYVRLLTGCLWSLRELLQLLPASEEPDPQPLTDLITNARFCKLARHSQPEVRRAWCGLVTCLCERRPALAAQAAARLTPAAVQTLSEQDPAVITDCWNAAVCLFTTLPEVWSHVNVRKTVLPPLWAVLREGGRGCAATLHPLMIVLLARLPSEVAGGEQPEFHRLFFSAMLQGLSVERVQQSPREVSVITRSLCECALYALRSNCGDAVGDVLVQQLCALTSEVVAGGLCRVSSHVLPPMAAALNSLYLLVGEGSCAPAAAAQRQYWCSLEKAVLRDYLTSEAATAAVVELLLSCASAGAAPAAAETRPRVTFSREAPPPPTSAQAALPPSPLAAAAASPLLECAAGAGQYLMDRARAGAASPLQQRQLARLLVSVPGTAERVARLPDSGPGWTLYRTLLTPELAAGGEALVAELTATVYRLCEGQERANLTRDATQNGYLAMMVELLRLASSPEADPDLVAWSLSQDLHSVLLASVDSSSAPDGRQQRERLLSAILLALGYHSNRGGEGDPAAALLLAAANRRWPLSVLSTLAAGYCSSPVALLAAHEAALRHDCSADALAALETRLAQLGTSTDAAMADQLRAKFSSSISRPWRARLAASTLRWARALGPARFCRQLAAVLPARWEQGAARQRTQFWLLMRRRSSLRQVPADGGKVPHHHQYVPEHLRTILLGLMRPSVQDDEYRQSAEEDGSSADLKQTAGLPVKLGPDPLAAGEVSPAAEESGGPEVGDSPTEEELGDSAAADSTTEEAGSPAAADSPPPVEVTDQVARYLPDLLVAQVTQPAVNHLLDTGEDLKAERQLTQLLTCLSGQQRQQVQHTLKLRATRGVDGVDAAALVLFLRLSGSVCPALPELLSDPAELPPGGSEVASDAAEPGSGRESSAGSTELLLAFVPLLPDSTLASLVAPPAEADWRRLALLAACVRELATRRGSDHLVAESGAALLATLDALVSARDDARLPASWEEVSSSWDQVVESIAVLHFFDAVLEHGCCLLEPPHWDLIMLSVSSWMAGLQELLEPSMDLWSPEHVAAAQLLCALCSSVCGAQAAVERCRDSQAQLAAEWDELYWPEWCRSLLPAFTRLATGDIHTYVLSFTLEALCSAVLLAPASALHQHALPALVDADLDESHLSAEVVTLLSWWRRLLSTRSRCVRLVAWQTMYRYLPFLAEAEQARTPVEDDRDDPRLPLPALFRVITTRTDRQVGSMLSSLPVGGMCHVNMRCPDTPAVVLTHLQTWHLALSYTSHLDTARKAMTAEALRCDGSLDRLLGQLLSLMPESPAHVPASYADTQLSYFQLPPRLNINGAATEEEIHHWACSTYCELLRQLPVLARGWRAGCERALTQRVDRLTSTHVSPMLLAEEFAKLQTADTTVDNMTVRARPSVREVCAVYTLEEAATELVVRLPADYPLGPVVADASGRRVGVAAGQWRTWMLQLTTFLTHQNGSVLAGLLLWKQNMDKRFQGVEECNICFYVLHGTNYQLPKLACRNCKKRFHPACLYKWFSTSSKSTCPMCRQLF